MSGPLPWDLQLVGESPGLAISVRYDDPSGRLAATLLNESGQTSFPTTAVVAAKLNLPADDGWALLDGGDAASEALIRVFGDVAEEGYSGAYVRNTDEGRAYMSTGVCAVFLPSQPSPALLAGLLKTDRFGLRVEISVDEDEDHVTGLALVFDVDGIELAAGESIELPPVLLLDGRDTGVMLERYANEVAAEMSARGSGEIPTGWRVTGDAPALPAIEKLTASRAPGKYIVIDAATSASPVEWLAADSPEAPELRAMAARIASAGYTPGIRLAPLLVPKSSAAFQANESALMRRRDGSVLLVKDGAECGVIDSTTTAGESLVQEVIETVVGWGYRYIEVGGLHHAAQPASEVAYGTAGTTALSSVRCFLEIVREATSEQVFVAAVDCPFGPAVGTVDAVRVGGPDSAGMGTALVRTWMHRRWWVNDPGVVLGGAGSPAEQRLATAVAALAGGAVFCDGAAMADQSIAALIPPAGIAAMPLEPGDGPVPSEWRVELGEGRALLGMVNWGDESRWVVVAEYLHPGEIAFDMWAGRILGKGDILLRPGEAALWQVSAPGQTPRLIGDTGHVSYDGLYQRQVSGRLQVRNDGGTARTIAVEARGREFEATLAPGEMRWFD